MPSVRVITAPDTHELRRRVLRDGTPSQEVRYPQDDRPDTVHLGAIDADGRLVGVSSWTPEPRADAPDGPDVAAVRLRGMAVDPEVRGGGHGARMVEAGVAWARRSGASVVWATARDAVLGFYERAGFEVVGDGFVDTATALPHHVVVRHLA